MAKVLGYIPGSSFIHRIHPLTKFIWLTGTLLLSIIMELPSLAASVCLVLIAAHYCGVLKPSLGYYRFLAVFAGVVVALSLLFTREGSVLLPAMQHAPSLLRWTDEGLALGLRTGLRMLFIAGVFPIFLGTTQPRDIVTTLVENLHVPYDYAFMFTSALRFIPTLIDEVEAISQAQKARGFEMDGRGTIARIKAYAPIAVPLVLSSLSRAERMAVAMETRGYGSGKRTHFYRSAMNVRDYTALGVLLTLAAATFLL